MRVAWYLSTMEVAVLLCLVLPSYCRTAQYREGEGLLSLGPGEPAIEYNVSQGTLGSGPLVIDISELYPSQQTHRTRTEGEQGDSELVVTDTQLSVAVSEQTDRHVSVAVSEDTDTQVSVTDNEIPGSYASVVDNQIQGSHVSVMDNEIQGSYVSVAYNGKEEKELSVSDIEWQEERVSERNGEVVNIQEDTEYSVVLVTENKDQQSELVNMVNKEQTRNVSLQGNKSRGEGMGGEEDNYVRRGDTETVWRETAQLEDRMDVIQDQVGVQTCPPCVCVMEDREKGNYIIHPWETDTVENTTTQRVTTTTTTTTATPTTTTNTPPTTIDTNTRVTSTHFLDKNKNLTTTPIITPSPTTIITTTTTTTSTTTITTTTSTTPTTTTTTTTTTNTTTSPPTHLGDLCLSESCVMAAGTILSSMDRSVDPCDDFYKFSCGGWAQRSPALNMDRFQAIDKRNQNIIRSILETDPPPHVTEAEQKARTFYRSCVKERETAVPEDLLSLQAVLEFAGGWGISGEQNLSMDLSERLYRMQNQLGVSVLFTWGVIAENGTNHIALVPGGWTPDLLEDPNTYLKLMAGISWLLAEASKCPPVDYDLYEDSPMTEQPTNDTEAEYEYTYVVESSRLTNFFSMVSGMFSSGGEVHEILPGEYDYDYDFIHETNDTMILTDDLDSSLSYSDHSTFPTGPSPMDLLQSEDAGPRIQTSAHNQPTFRTDRDQCMDKLRSEIELGREAMAALVEEQQGLEEAMRSVQDLERKLRNLTNSGPDSTDGQLLAVSLSTLQEKYGFIQWESFLRRAFKIIDHELSEDVTILISADYLEGVNKLVSHFSSTPQLFEILKNYMAWRLVAQFYPGRKYTDEARRGEQCLKQTEDVFGPVVTAMYVRHKTVEASTSLVEEVDMMVDIMKDAFSTTLHHLAWMTEKSRVAALEKLAGMMDLIGYPEQVLNSTWLNNKYSEVEVTSDYLMNIVAFQSHQRKEGMKLYTRPYERGSWAEMSHGGSIVTVNAFYSPNSNTMIVPIGMLQEPLYWSQPKSLTFGAFGIVVAHEITHAFDDSGINYNSEGMTAQLYDDVTISGFHESAQCLVSQYSNYTVADTAVDGNLTLGENLADHGGLSMALSAYTRWRGQHRDYRLPALPFDDMQLFFIGYALPWCSRHTAKHAQNQVENDEHAPERFRVLGPLSNSKEFSEAFQCPVGSPMNPEEKCSVW